MDFLRIDPGSRRSRIVNATERYIREMFSNKNNKLDGDPYGIRTRVAAVKGRCPEPLDEGAFIVFYKKFIQKST